MPKLLYPDEREISMEEVIRWGTDHRVDGVILALNVPYLEGAPYITKEQRHENGRTVITISVQDPTYEEARDELSDAGLTTFVEGES